MFSKKDDTGYIQAFEGIKRKTTAYGDLTLLVEFKMDAGSTVPAHAHPYEQTGYLVSGRIRLSIGDDTFEVEPGDSWCIPRDIQHKSCVLADSVAVEVFSPAREDYLPMSSG